MKPVLLALALLPGLCLTAQAQPRDTVRVLFLGNSLTFLHDIPGQIQSLASAGGDTLIYEQHTPGGYILSRHATDSNGLRRLLRGGWDWVVLQEQSQVPTVPHWRAGIFWPSARYIDSLARTVCVRTMLYQTFGRRYGGQQCLPDANGTNYCSATFAGYEPMQDTLSWAYDTLAQMLDCPRAPVGEAFRHAYRYDTSTTLWEPDNFHQGRRGAYLAACTFYSMFFHRSAVGNTYTANLPSPDVDSLQRIGSRVVLDSLAHWGIDTTTWALGVSGGFSADTLRLTGTSNRPAQLFWQDTAGRTLPGPLLDTLLPVGTHRFRLGATHRCDTLWLDTTLVRSAAPGDTSGLPAIPLGATWLTLEAGAVRTYQAVAHTAVPGYNRCVAIVAPHRPADTLVLCHHGQQAFLWYPGADSAVLPPHRHHLVFDYSLDVGDTFYHNRFGPNATGRPFRPLAATVVSRKDSVFRNGQQLPRLQLLTPRGTQLELIYPLWHTDASNGQGQPPEIGPSTLFRPTDTAGPDARYQLICYTDSLMGSLPVNPLPGMAGSPQACNADSAQLRWQQILGRPNAAAQPFRSIYPNPVPAGGSLSLQLAQPASQPLPLALWDATGRQVAQTTLPAGTSSYRWALPPHLPAGLYHLRVDGQAGARVVVR